MNNNVSDIFEKKCIKCGSCIGVCRENAIDKIYSKKEGFYKLKLDEKKCNSCGLCRIICPTLNESEKSENFIGKYKNIILAYANDLEIRKNATSGGIVWTLIKTALLENVVDEVYLLGLAKNAPMQTGLYRLKKEDLDVHKNNRMFASRYVSYPICEAVKDLIPEKKYLFVGTPCQIKGVKKCAEYKNLNIFCVGVACSGAVSYLASWQAQRKLYKKFDSKKDLYYYRGNGWPGYNSIETDNGSTYDERHLNSYFNALYSSRIFMNKGCRYCEDQLAETADISCFDFWNKEESKNETIGKSGVIIRTDEGSNLIEMLKTKKEITVLREINEQQVILSQNIPIRYKKILLKKKNRISIQIYYIIADIILKLRIYRIMPKALVRKMSNLYNKIVIKCT